MIKIVDTTLRDGEQAPGVAFNLREKVNIARMLDWLGVYQIEAGIPVMGELEQKAIRAIVRSNLKARVSTWNRPLLADIRASLACGVRYIHIACPVSEIQIRYKLGRSRMWLLDCLKRAMRYASDYGCRVTVGAEDASRADASFLLDLAFLAQEMGAERLRYCDTLGVLNPFTTVERLGWLRSNLSLEIEFHGHNDFGMATANTLAAIKAGIRYVDTTVEGLGERAGNASLEELVAAVQGVYGTELGLEDRLLPLLSRHVARAARRRVNWFEQQNVQT